MFFGSVIKFPIATHTAAERTDKRLQSIEVDDFCKLIIRELRSDQTAVEQILVLQQVPVAAEEEALFVTSHLDQLRVGHPRRRKRVETGHAQKFRQAVDVDIDHECISWQRLWAQN